MNYVDDLKKILISITMNNNMINPANYYNPFAKYNYTSKTRGVYVPKDAELLKFSQTEKSSNIFSENYDAQTEIDECLKNEDTVKGGLFGFVNDFFKKS